MSEKLLTIVNGDQENATISFTRKQAVSHAIAAIKAGKGEPQIFAMIDNVPVQDADAMRMLQDRLDRPSNRQEMGGDVHSHNILLESSVTLSKYAKIALKRTLTEKQRQELVDVIDNVTNLLEE